MRWNKTPWAMAAAIMLTAPLPAQAFDLTGKIVCTWREAGQDCTGVRCYNTRQTGERSFLIDFEAKSMCTGRDAATCGQPIKFAIAEREGPTKTAILIAHAPDGALMMRVAESGKIIGVIIAGIERVVVNEGTCQKR